MLGGMWWRDRAAWLMCLAVISASLTVLWGCDQRTSSVDALQKRPRPVSVSVLRRGPSPDSSLVTASVGSWKTEQIGFEVGGRIEYVVEPNTEIEGRVTDSDGNLLIQGTPIAEIENERYRLQVDRAKADIARAEQALAAAQTEFDESIPAQIAAAQATRDLADSEYRRSRRLFEKNAGSQGEVDQNKANLQNAVSQIKQLDASRKAKQAELTSLQAALLQSYQQLRDAQRDLEDCTLFSSFRGQIADVSVVPGSVVAAGQPVATIQMMNPIKVELEVSAEDSRRLRGTEHLPVTVTMPDGSLETHEGFLYLIDPVADPLTRTFTITLLVLNQKFTESVQTDITATTDQTWRLDFKFLPGATEGMLFASEDAIHQDDQGHYLWRVDNLTVDSKIPEDRLLKVRRLPVRMGKLKVPYLGNWVFQQVLIDDASFDPPNHLVAGKLTLSGGGDASTWKGDSIMLDTGSQWMMRPGDLVRVDLSGGRSGEGYFVAMDAIIRDTDTDGFYLFTIDSDSAQSVAKRVPIEVIDRQQNSVTSGMRRIQAVGDQSLEGMRYVRRGAHYLVDGEIVNPILSPEPGK